jgi:MFS family permease
MDVTKTRGLSVFTGVLFSAMGVATFGPLSLGILASVIINDLDISRMQLGIVFAVNAVGAAVISPLLGRFADRFGGKTALITVACVSAASFVVYGVAWSLGVLILGSLFGAVAQAGANPATNKLIATELSPGAQGVTTGIKQSGVQAFLFVGGLVVPALALSLGRATTYIVLALMATAVATAAGVILRTSKAEPARVNPGQATHRVPPEAWWIATYGLLLGFAGSAAFMFVLFTQEELGRSLVVSGAVAALVGLIAMPSRIIWARYAEKRSDFRTPLLAMAAISVGASACLLVADAGAWWFVWLAAVLTAIGSSSWNSVGMLSMIVIAGPSGAGRASGVVMFGFLIGLGAGPPIFGRLVDSTGSYTTVWWLAAVASLGAVALMAAWNPRPLSVPSVAERQ